MSSTKKQVKLNPPDLNYREYCRVFFESDADVEVGAINIETRSFTITVGELNKFIILNKLLNGVHTAGLMTWFVDVKLADNYKVVKGAANPAEMAFRGNVNFERVIRLPGAIGDIDVVVFKPTIVQPKVDNWSNPDGGIESYTYEQMAALVFEAFPQTTFTTASMEKNVKKRR